MDEAFKFYLHDLIEIFEADFDDFQKSSEKKFQLNSDDKPYTHTVYMYFRDALNIETNEYNTTIFNDSVPNLGNDLLNEIFKRSGINFKVSISRDMRTKPPLVLITFTKLY